MLPKIHQLKSFYREYIKISTVKDKELDRLRRLPRYRQDQTIFLGEKIKIADACTFLGGVREIFDREIYEFQPNTSSPFIVDCGANIGLSVIYFKQLFPDAIIEAFEPDPEIFDILKFNINSFQFEEVTVFQKAVWSENGIITFRQEGGFSGRIPKPEDKDNLIEVPCVDLSEILLKKPVDFLKIDIEGAEYEVLLSCRKALSNVKNIFIEYHSHITERQTLHEVLEILQANGFRYHVHEAFTRKKPYVDRDTMLGMDLQLNIFGYRH